MSKKTLITLFAAGLVAVLAVARLAVAVFPVHAIVHHEAVDQKEPVQVVSGGEYLLHGGHVGYPESAIKQKIAGTVVVEFTTDARGQVTDARVLSGPEQLRKAALSSVLEWHYDPARHAAGTAQAAISFQPPQEREGDTGITVKVDEGFLHKRLAETQHQLEHLQHHGSGAEHAQRHGSEAEEARLMREIVELNQAIERGGTFEVRTVEARSSEPHLRERLAKAQQQLERSSDAGSREEVAKIERQIHELKTAMAEREETVGPARVRSIRTDGVSEASRDNLMNRLGVHVGDQIDDAKMREIQETLRGIDEHLRLRTERGHDGTVALIIIVRD